MSRKTVKLFVRRARLLAALFGGYKFQIGVLIVLGFLSGLFGGFGIGVVIPLFSFAVKDGTLGTDFISRAVAEAFAYFGFQPSITLFLALISLLFVIKAVVLLVFGRITAHISSDFEKQTMDRLYRLTFSANWPFLLRQKIGHLQNFLTVNVQHASHVMFLVSVLFLNFANFLIFFIIALKLSAAVTMLAIGLGAAILIASRPLLGRSRSYARAKAQLGVDIAHEVNENASGLKVIKAMSAEERAARPGFAFFEKSRILKVKAFVVKTLNIVAIEPLSTIFVIVLFAVLYNRPQFDLGVFAVIIYSIHRIFTYVNNLQDSLHSLTTSFQYVQQLASFQTEVSEHQETDRGRRAFQFEDKLEFREVSFSYRGTSVPALDRVSFGVRKGQMLGIIGPSGAGKTTITDLVLRLFRPSGGAILIDGVDIEEIGLKEWRSKVGYVPQDAFLKNDTIANNIRFYDETLSDARIRTAAEMAYLGDLIARLPAGLETVVGERGVRLSGGERQRIALARAFARSPKILVLDEATSALDHESEVMIQKAIAALKGETTIIAIAHRLSTIMHADRLIIVREGRVEEEGVPGELLKNADSYFYKAHQIIAA